MFYDFPQNVKVPSFYHKKTENYLTINENSLIFAPDETW
jgi:hypothetical protein